MTKILSGLATLYLSHVFNNPMGGRLPVTERERRLRAGHVERMFLFGASVSFYWEPYFDEKDQVFRQAFTIDHGGTRWRGEDFDTALRTYEDLERNLSIKAALKALGIEGEAE
jgi:hypothetical protein